jgi:hypothetical protein
MSCSFHFDTSTKSSAASSFFSFVSLAPIHNSTRRKGSCLAL